MKHLSAGALLLLTVVGYSGAIVAARADAVEQQEQLDRDAQEIRNYRLTMPVIRKIGDAYRNLAKVMASDPRYQEVARLKAEMEKLEAKEEPSDAEMARMEQLATEIEQAEAALPEAGMNNAKTIGDMARKMEAVPQAAAAVRSAGLTTREFATAQLALMQAMFAYGFLKAGTIKELPKDVSAENVQFLKENEAEIEKLAKEWEKLGDGQ